MIAIEVQGLTDTRRYLAQAQQQLPFALSLALNRTASALVRQVRANVRGSFTLRQPYVLDEVQQLRWADKERGHILGQPRNADVDVPGLKPGEMAAVVGLHPNPKGGQARKRPILERFETGRPKVGGVAVPTTTLRPSFAARVPRQYYPTNLGFTPRRQVEGGMASSGRKFGAFVFGNPGSKSYGIWARWPGQDRLREAYTKTGKRRKKQQMPAAPTTLVKLWHLKASVPIPVRLGFFRTAALAASLLRGEVQRALAFALRTAR